MSEGITFERIGTPVSVNVTDFGAVGDGVADDTTAIQAAFDYLETTAGGVLVFPAGTYKTTATVSFSNAVTHRCTIYGQNARIAYYGTGYALDFDSTGYTTASQYPVLSIIGLNVVDESGGSATGGIRIQNMTSAWLENVYVAGFDYNYTFENSRAYSELITMMHCAAVNAGVTHIRFQKSGTGTNSFARFNIYSLFCSAATYCFHVHSGCAVSDSCFKNINGNFSGTAIAYIEGNMEGSIIDGIFTEAVTGIGGIIKLSDPTTIRSPIVMNIGNYVNNVVGPPATNLPPTPWIDNSDVTTWPTYAAGVQLFSPLFGRGANVDLEWRPKDDSFQTPANFEKRIETVTALAVTSETPTTHTTTATIWNPTLGGASGRLVLRATSGAGAGRTACEVSFAAEAGLVTQNVMYLHKATRATYDAPTVDTVVINTDGTVSFNYAKVSAPAANDTIDVTISVMT